MIPLFLVIALSVVYGCTGMVQDELDATHAKLEALKEKVREANRQISDLNAILGALDNSRTILRYDPADDGYDITFRDGQAIHIHYGVDGIDGRVLIPVGVRYEDGYYYWQVDGEWLLDADGNMIRAGATDGVDGIAPLIKVEDGNWLVSTDGGENWEIIATCEEMDGVGVFSGIETDDPSKLVLILWDGTRIELPYYVPLSISFNGPVMDTLLVAGGEPLTIPYVVSVEGEAVSPVIVTAGTDGTYIPVIGSQDQLEGEVSIIAPDPFVDGYITLSAFSGGYSAVKVISFLERRVPVKKMTVRLDSGLDTCPVPYDANFEYTVSVDYPDLIHAPEDDWLEVVPDFESGTIEFRTTKANLGVGVRFCTVTLSPKDNPDYECTTFLIKQASEMDVAVDEVEADASFSFDREDMVLYAPAEGGDADIWMTTLPLTSLSPYHLDDAGWVTTGISSEHGFWKLHVHVDQLEADEPRQARIRVNVTYHGFLLFDSPVITVIQK